MPARSSSIVTALTAAALVVVGVVGYQASASATDPLTQVRSDGSHAPKSPSKPDRHKKKDKAPGAVAIPASSGEGQRVVYSLGAERVWLVGADDKTRRSFEVAPSSVSPSVGTYSVTSRSVSITGSDGVAIEHVVRFAGADSVVIGFSAAVDGSMPEPDPSKKTGGIREARDDGKAMWDFALHGTKVVVVN
ncbi:hypothetical protein [Streptomyces sp. NPDC017993]|uniref:hypothetical protein n=1 Tax=Streptomyces sp. NPDC017993 TaxID=3365027 RepID=UPI0037AFF118